MNAATITDLAWEGAKVAFRLIMAARSRRDAEAIVHQLRALGETPRSDVAGIEADALRRLRQDEPTQSTRTPLAPDFPGKRAPWLCDRCGKPMSILCGDGECTPVGGPLGEGD